MSLPLLTATGQHDLVAAADQASAPVGVVRRFSFIGLQARVGTSTVAETVSRALARGRSGRTLLASSEPAGAMPAPAPAELTEGMPRAVSERIGYQDGLFTLGLNAPAPSTVGPMRSASVVLWREQIAPAVRYFDIVCTDWTGDADAFEILDRSRTSQAVCLIAPYSRVEGENTLAIARAIHQTPDAPAVTVGFVDTARTGSTWPRMVADRLPFPVVLFGHDRALATGRRPVTRTVRAATLVAAALMRGSSPSGSVR